MRQTHPIPRVCAWRIPLDARHPISPIGAAPIRRELVGRLTEKGMSTRAIGAVLGVDDRTVRRDTGAANAAPDPLAEEKADGRVVKLTGPGSLLHSEPVERIDYVTGEVLTGEGRNPVPPGVGYPTGAP